VRSANDMGTCVGRSEFREQIFTLRKEQLLRDAENQATTDKLTEQMKNLFEQLGRRPDRFLDYRAPARTPTNFRTSPLQSDTIRPYLEAELNTLNDLDYSLRAQKDFVRAGIANALSAIDSLEGRQLQTDTKPVSPNRSASGKARDYCYDCEPNDRDAMRRDLVTFCDEVNLLLNGLAAIVANL